MANNGNELDLADAIVDVLNGETFEGKTTTAVRGYFLKTELTKIQKAAAGTANVVVLPLSIEGDESDRESDLDEITIQVVFLGKVTGYENDKLDPFAHSARAINKRLREDAAEELELNGNCYTRTKPPTRPAVWDSEWIRSMGVFATSIVCRYETDVDR